MGVNPLEAARRHLEQAANAPEPSERLYNIREAHQLVIAAQYRLERERRVLQ